MDVGSTRTSITSPVRASMRVSWWWMEDVSVRGVMTTESAKAYGGVLMRPWDS